MGQSQSCGFGVLNLSNWEEINVGLSMGRTHYYENSVKKGTIFYRWPGAVWYTVFVLPRKEFGSNDIMYASGCPRGSEVVKIKNCYGGDNGTWLIITGGAYTDDDGKFWPQDLKMKLTSQEDVFRKGVFTEYSHAKFHTCDGLRCTENCPYCTI